MARKKKELGVLDECARQILNDAYLDSGLSQAEIAKRTGLSQNRVSIILRGDTPPASVGELDLIASALSLTIEEVIRVAVSNSRPGLSVVPSILEGQDLDEVVRKSAALDPGYSPEMEDEQPGS